MSEEKYPGEQFVKEAIAKGWVRKCSLCGGEVLGNAIACTRPGCPVHYLTLCELELLKSVR